MLEWVRLLLHLLLDNGQTLAQGNNGVIAEVLLHIDLLYACPT